MARRRKNKGQDALIKIILIILSPFILIGMIKVCVQGVWEGITGNSGKEGVHSVTDTTTTKKQSLEENIRYADAGWNTLGLMRGMYIFRGLPERNLGVPVYQQVGPQKWEETTTMIPDRTKLKVIGQLNELEGIKDPLHHFQITYWSFDK